MLRKLETRKGSKVLAAKRTPSTSSIVRGLRKLECLVNYCNKKRKRGAKIMGGRWFVSDLVGCDFPVVGRLRLGVHLSSYISVI